MLTWPCQQHSIMITKQSINFIAVLTISLPATNSVQLQPVQDRQLHPTYSPSLRNYKLAYKLVPFAGLINSQLQACQYIPCSMHGCNNRITLYTWKYITHKNTCSTANQHPVPCTFLSMVFKGIIYWWVIVLGDGFIVRLVICLFWLGSLGSHDAHYIYITAKILG